MYLLRKGVFLIHFNHFIKHPHLLIHSHETGLLVQRAHKLSSYRLHHQQQVVYAGHVAHCLLFPGDLRGGLLEAEQMETSEAMKWWKGGIYSVDTLPLSNFHLMMMEAVV